MKLRNFKSGLTSFTIAFSAIPAALPSAHAADATWSSSTTGNWSLGTNWVGAAAPGANGTLTSADVATFSDAAGGTITLDTTAQNVSGLLFSGTPGAYLIGSLGANAGNSLFLSSGGTINVTSSNAVNQTVNAPLVLAPATSTTAGTYTIQNNNSSTGALILNGNITGGTTTQGITLTLGGTNTSASNLISGRIADGTATGKVAVTKSGAGTWTLSGNNTYTGATTISGGTLKLGSATGISSGSVLTVSTGTFDLNGFNGTITALGAGAGTGTITNSATGSGTNTLTMNAATNNVATLITDGATAKTALILKGGGLPWLSNANNTFSGGLTIASGANTRLYQLSGVANTVDGNGTLLKSSLGTGTINIGDTGNTASAQLALSGSSVYNAIVFNAANLYPDGGRAAVRADGAESVFYGTLTAGASDISFGTAANGLVKATGKLTGSKGLMLNTGNITLTLANAAANNDYAGNTTLTSLTKLNLGASNQIADGAGKGNLIVTSGTFNMAGFSDTINGLSGNGTVDGGNSTANATLTVGNDDATGANNTFSGVLKNTTGRLALTKIGNGTLTLSGNNTYGGGTAINAGTVQFAKTSAMSGTGNVTVASGSTLAINAGGAGEFGNGASGNGTIGGIFSGTGGQGAGVTLTSGAVVGIDTTNAGGALSYAGNINNSGIGLSKLGTGTLTLAGNNTYSGNTTVSAGTLKAGSATALSLNSAISVSAGGTLDLGGFNYTMNSLAAGSATSTITDSSAAGGGAMLTITTALGAAPTQLFTGSLGLNIFGGNTVNTILSNTNNTYSGGTILGANGTTGTRYLGSGTIGTGSPGNITKGTFGTGTITMGLAATDRSQIYSSGALTINNAIVVNTALGDGAAVSPGAFRNEGGTLTLNGTVNANLADALFTSSNAVGRESIVNGAISGLKGVAVSAYGNGGSTLTLNSTANANTYAGNTTVISGNATGNSTQQAFLKLGASNQIADGAGKGHLVITGGIFNMAGFSETINGLSGNGTVDGGNSTTTSTLTVGNADATGANNTFSGVLKNSTTGTLALTKIGTGTLTLSGNSTFTGATTVSGGKLSIGSTGKISTTSGISIGAAEFNYNSATALSQAISFSSTGGKLSGNGTITPAVTISAGNTLAPGNSIGTLSFGSGLSIAGIYSVELGTANATASSGLSDRAVVTGDLDLTGSTLTLVDNAGANSQGSAGAGAYRLATYTGGLTGTFGTVNPLSGSLHEVVSYGSGVVDLSLYRLATATAPSASLNLGNVRVGGTLAGSASVTNSASSDGFSEQLKAVVTGDGTGFTGVAGGANGTVNYSLSTATAGSKSGSASVVLKSTDVGTKYGDTTLSTTSVELTGGVYNAAAADTLAATVDLGKIRVGSSFGAQALTITNTSASGSFTEGLNATMGATTDDATVSGANITNLSGLSSSTDISVGLGSGAKTTAGAYTGTVGIGFASNGTNSGLSDLSLSGQSVTVNGAVYDYATADFTKTSGVGTLALDTTHTYTFDFGGGLLLNTDYTATIRLVNGVFGVDNVYQDALKGSYSNIGSGFTTTATSFNNLVAGGSNSFTIKFNTATLGLYTDTLTFSGQSQQSGLADASLGDYTIALSATAIPEPDVAMLLGGLGMLSLLRRRRA